MLSYVVTFLSPLLLRVTLPTDYGASRSVWNANGSVQRRTITLR